MVKKMNDRMKEIREKYGITREKLNALDMDEFDYEVLQERTLKNYIKGHLTDICELDGSVDLDQIAENIFDMKRIITDEGALQKMILGEIVGCHKNTTRRGELVSVSWQITRKA